MFCTADTDAPLSGQIVDVPKSWSKYINNTYKLSLMYPPLWAKLNNLHYAGIDGYFRISELKTDKTLEDVCKSEAFHKLQPYGSNPSIVSDTATGLDACLILPSEDQPTDMKKQSALIIKYTKGKQIDNQLSSYIILYTDMEHLKELKNSLIIED